MRIQRSRLTVPRSTGSAYRELVTPSYGDRRGNASVFGVFSLRFRRAYAAFLAAFDRGGVPTVRNLNLVVRARGLSAAALVALVLAASVGAYESPAKLADVAHVYSLGVGEVRCASRGEWDADFASSVGWAYTNVRDEYTVLGPRVCAGALGVGSSDVPLWQQALGALVLTHEAFHLRRWRFRGHEGKVECQAIVYFKDAARRLGATEAEAENLYPYALALHTHQVRLFPRYRDPQCVIPPWAPPVGP
jgi:hypothetical protein